MRKIAENYKLPYYTMSPTYSVCQTHGYLTGEHFTCPHCGKSAEVYSRITGYYRPVQNWNNGKAQEYKQRREYAFAGRLGDDLYARHLAENAKREEATKQDVVQPEVKPAADGQPLLFATATCPNCRIACQYLDKAGISYTKILAEENADKAAAYGIKQAPTLVLPDGTKIAGAGAIKGYINSIKA